jgi:hypothetical protein
LGVALALATVFDAAILDLWRSTVITLVKHLTKFSEASSDVKVMSV